MSKINGSGEYTRLLSTMASLNICEDPFTERSFSYNTLGNIARYCNENCRKIVVLVGSNPSGKSPDCSAFHPATKSRQFVDKWFEDKDYHLVYMNLVDYKTEGNKPLKLSELDKDEIHSKFKKYTTYKDSHIISCGQTASKGLARAKIPHFAMPHPSGLCRFWNDKEAGEAKVKEMLEWLERKT
jgi:hypothetical protein